MQRNRQALLMKKSFLCLAVSLILTNNCQAVPEGIFSHPLYFGIGAGFGATTWYALVPQSNQQNKAMSISTPKHVNEGGGTVNIFAGFDITQTFGLEFGYYHYANAKVGFAEDSLFEFNHHIYDLVTRTDSYYFMTKFMVQIADTAARAYSGLGFAMLHRRDQVNSHYRKTPSFDIGINYNIAEHWMADLNGNFTAGYGASEICPADDFMPFVYSIIARLAYRF